MSNLTYMKSPSLKNLPRGIDDDELLKIVCEFKLGRFHNKEKFVLAYVRLAISIAHRMSNNSNRKDLISEAFIALLNVPEEVKDRMYNYNIVGYLIRRIRTRCLEYYRRDHVLYFPKEDKRALKKMPRLLRQDIDLTTVAKEKKNLELLEHQLSRCIETEFDRLLIHYKTQGYFDAEIANILGCSPSKVNRAREVLQQRFNIIRNPLKKVDILTKLEQLNLKLISANVDERKVLIDEIREELCKTMRLDLPSFWDCDSPDALFQKYHITRTNNKPIDPRALFFVLRLDKYGRDLAMVKASRVGLQAFINELKADKDNTENNNNTNNNKERLITDLTNFLNKIKLLQPIE